jgi:hypothetical protein
MPPFLCYTCYVCYTNRLAIQGVKMFARVAVLGSRSLPGPSLALVASVVHSLAAAGVASFSTCCASGACSAARAAFASLGVRFAVFAASAFPASTFAGSLSLRSAACVRGVVAGGAVVVFLGSPSSVGSCNELRLAISLGVPAFAFACGFPSDLLPLFGPGGWVPVSSGPLAGSFQWSPFHSQPALF